MAQCPLLSKYGKPDSRFAKAYCECWTNKKNPVPWKQMSPCVCGEDSDVCEWGWKKPNVSVNPSWVVVSEDCRLVTFHPFYSSGTAAVKGDITFEHDYHYYWELKMLTETYGTDIMVGVGTDKVNVVESLFKFTSLLGQDTESYGLSYTGAVRHSAIVSKESVGFCRGSIIGVRVDMWRGTLEFYLNRVPQGIAFYNLRRHKFLFPMVSSTAAQSSLRLIYASSWRASLLVDAAKILSASINSESKPKIPPGLWHKLKKHYWLVLPTERVDDEVDSEETSSVKLPANVRLSSGMKRRHWQILPRRAGETRSVS